MDGTATPWEYAERAAAVGMTAVAVTDHGTMSAHREFDAAMRKHNIKPIFGVEAYVTHDINDRRSRASRTEPLDRLYNHLTIVAKNVKGYKNLSRLNEIAWADGHFHKPRIDFNLLNEYRDGLIVGSACMGGLINSALEVGDFAVAKDHVSNLRDIFGDDFYIEVMPHNVPGMNQMLYDLADEFKIKTIVTPDCHHAHKGQKVIQEIMLIANTHPKELTEEDHVKRDEANVDASDSGQPLPFPDIDYSDLDPQDAIYMSKLDGLYGADRQMTFNKFDIHLMSGQEMFDAMDVKRMDSFENTVAIGESIADIRLPENLDLLPTTFENAHETIRVRCTKFLDDGGYSKEYYDRLEEELQVIGDKGFDPYFLIVNDVVNWAKSQGILVGPGRGSGVGSLVNYALGNTGIDPIEHGLLFFRFIDPSRPDWPDIDTDFQDTRRDEVKAYVAERYGHVASIATYQKFTGKGMIKDIARVFRIPLSEVSRVTKLIDTWEEYETSQSVKWFRDRYPFVLEYGRELRGRTRGTGVHPSGLVTSRVALADVAPIETRKPAGGDRIPVIAVDMDETADIGLIKLDILGLKALSTITDTLDLIKQRTDQEIDLDSIPMDDPAVFESLSNGYTAGVFQAEQAPYTKLLVQMGVSGFNDLVATNALVRPGAANTIGPEYVMRKQGRKRTSYVHESTESFTKDTYGLFVYQEQIMLLCTELAGMSMIEANAVRKITAKKKDASLLEEYRAKFVSGAEDKIGLEKANDLWDDILKWSDYGFNKCTAGDTVVWSAGKNRGFSGFTIQEMYNRLQDPSIAPHWVKKFYSKGGVRVLSVDEDGRVRPRKVEDVHYNGTHRAVKIVLENGMHITSTLGHRHMTPAGWAVTSDVSVGDMLMTVGDYRNNGRLRAWQVGKPMVPSAVVSIEDVGEIETYDLEMDSDSEIGRSWVGNGIVTHNSHAVAYSRVTYIMAWLKQHFPVEFMTATLTNERDKNSRTQYLIEAKRMGINVMLPHINRSKSDFTIENGGIRMGLSSIKFVSDKIANKYLENGPYKSFKEVEAFTFTKGSGVNSGALAAMDKVGAVSFDEHQVDKEFIRSNLYEYLNLPEVSASIPQHWPAFMTPADEFEDKGAHVMMGIVTNVRRGKGWSLITVMDKTGEFGVFDKEDSEVVKGGSYVMLVGSNRIAAAIPVNDAPKSDSSLVRWLNETGPACAKNELFVLNFNSRKTKAGKNMGTMIVSTHDRDLFPVVVFPTQFPTAWAKLKPGNAYRMTCEEGRDGDMIFKTVE